MTSSATLSAAPAAMRCSVCAAGPHTAAERADLATEWLVAGPELELAARRFCRGCAPAGLVDDIACVRCGDGPLLVGELCSMTLEATVAVDSWLAGRGWRLAGPVCPGCLGELTR